MSNVKVAYKDIIALLEANKNKKVSTIMPQLLELVTSSVRAKTFVKDDNDNVTHIFCYYHKKWESLTIATYGKKASSSTGFNTMCKEGVSQWSKQQRHSKLALSTLLDSLANGNTSIDDLPTLKDAIEEARTLITPREDGHAIDNDSI